MFLTAGAGELIVTFIDREGTFSGLDEEFVEILKNKVNIPLVVSGGVSSRKEIYDVINKFDLSGIGVGSLFVYKDSEKSVLVNYPQQVELENNLEVYKRIYEPSLYKMPLR